MKHTSPTFRLAIWQTALGLGSLLMACSPQRNDLPAPAAPASAQHDTTHVTPTTPAPLPGPPRDTTRTPVPSPPPVPVPPRDTTRH